MYPNYPNQPSNSYSNQIGFNFDSTDNSYPSNSPYPNQSSYPSQFNSSSYSSGPSYPSYPNYDNSYSNNYNNNNNYPPYQPGPPPQLPPPGPSLNPYDPNPNSFNNYNNNTNSFYNNLSQFDNYNNYNQVPPSFDTYNPTPLSPPPPPSSFDNFSSPPLPPLSSVSGGSFYPNLSNFNQQTNNTTSGIYNSYGNTYYEGTVKPYAPFNPLQDAERLYRAMKGFGTDETTLIDVLCKRTYSQRLEIAACFKTSYGKDLVKKIKDETSSNFEQVLVALIKTPIELECNDLRDAIQGLGTKESTVIDIMCTKSNSEMIELKEKYRQLYNRDVIHEVADDTSGFFKRILVSLGTANRSENLPDFARAVQQADELYRAGVKRLGTDEVTFNRIFSSESLAHLRVVFDEYKNRTGRDIESAIKSEMSGDVERAFLALVDYIKSPPQYFARRLYESMAGLGTRDRTLIRLVVTRCERDMIQIKQEFQRKYGKSLESFIKGDCSGDYKRALLCLVGDPNWK